jgi:hypothetical protein
LRTVGRRGSHGAWLLPPSHAPFVVR